MKIKSRNWKHYMCFLVLTLFVFSHVSAQTQSVPIQGTVYDANQEPIIGASVLIKGTGTGTATNIEGQFSVNAPLGSTLVFSSVGYTTKEVLVESQQITVTLSENTLLDEVLVIGYATGSKRTSSGAIDRITKADMNVGVVSTPLDALKGKVAGVNISKVGGDPTAGPSIRVRGTTSLSGGNDPLVVIDGVFGDLNMLNAISPSDIESFTILKDAAELAQYGSRGASGVIVVATAKGKFNQAKISYEGNFAVDAVYKNIEMLDGNQFRNAVENLNVVGALDMGHNTNFAKAMQQTGYTQNHRVSFTGGSELSNYRASFGIVDQKGIIKNNSMKNYTAKLDLSQYYFGKALKFDAGVFGSKKENRFLNDYFKTFYSAMAMNPTFPSTPNDDGTWPFDVNANEVQNPLGRLTIKDQEDNAYVNLNTRLTWTIQDGLNLSVFGSYTYNNKENAKYIPRTIQAGLSDRGSAERTNNRSDKLMGNVSLEYKKKIDNHAFNLLGVAEGQKYTDKGFKGMARGFNTDFFETDNLKAGAVVKWGDVDSWYNEFAIISYLARANYVYADKYIATVNLRTDGSSKLGADNKWGFFPSASLAWNMDEEAFIKSLTFVDNLKIRTGYGVTGNQDAIDPYRSLLLRGVKELGVALGNNQVSYEYTRNANKLLKWETKKSFNVGFDATVLNNLLDVTFDYYYSRTSNLLYTYQVPVPPFVHNELLANVGSLDNSGVELGITVRPIRTKDMDLTIGVNTTFQRTKLITLSGDWNGQLLNPRDYISVAGVSGAGAIGGENNVTYNMVGRPLGTFYIPRATGLVNDGLGSYSYNIVDLDENGDVDISDSGDRYDAGQAMPKVLLGSNISFRYKQFDIQTQLNGAFGHKIFNGTSLALMNMNYFPTYNVLEEAPSKNIRDQRVSDYWLEKGDYLNIAYLSLGYNINTSKIGWVDQIRISATVNNLHTFTNYSGLSPMINSSIVNDNLGVDDKRFYPLYRSYSIGLNVTF